MSPRRVLQIGIDPAVVDFSAYRDQDVDQLRSRIRAAEAQLRAAGFEVTVCQVPDEPDAAAALVRVHLAERVVDVVEIGSGLRTSHDYTEVFERVVNTVVATQPGVRLCFNDSHESTLDAVRRVTHRA